MPHHGDALCDASGVVRRLEDAAPPRLNPPEELGEAPKRVGAEDQVHMPEGLPQFFRDVGLLSHAAAQADDLVGVFPLGVGQRAHIAQHPLLGVLPDGAGVDDDDRRLTLVLGESIPHLCQIPPDTLRIRLVLLTPVGVHIGQGSPVEPGVELLYFGAVRPLPGDVVRGNPCRLPLQNRSSV